MLDSNSIVAFDLSTLEKLSTFSCSGNHFTRICKSKTFTSKLEPFSVGWIRYLKIVPHLKGLPYFDKSTLHKQWEIENTQIFKLRNTNNFSRFSSRSGSIIELLLKRRFRAIRRKWWKHCIATLNWAWPSHSVFEWAIPSFKDCLPDLERLFNFKPIAYYYTFRWSWSFRIAN